MTEAGPARVPPGPCPAAASAPGVGRCLPRQHARPAAGAGLPLGRAGRGGPARRAHRDPRRRGRLGADQPAACRPDQRDRGRRGRRLGPRRQLGLGRPVPGAGPGHPDRGGGPDPRSGRPGRDRFPGFRGAGDGTAAERRGPGQRRPGRPGRGPVHQLRAGQRRPCAAARPAAGHLRRRRAGRGAGPAHRAGHGPPDHPAGGADHRGDPGHGRGERAARVGDVPRRASCASWPRVRPDGRHARPAGPAAPRPGCRRRARAAYPGRGPAGRARGAARRDYRADPGPAGLAARRGAAAGPHGRRPAGPGRRRRRRAAPDPASVRPGRAWPATRPTAWPASSRRPGSPWSGGLPRPTSTPTRAGCTRSSPTCSPTR